MYNLYLKFAIILLPDISGFGELMFETLMSKTFMILTGSLFFAWLGSLLSVHLHNNALQRGSSSIRGYNICASIVSIVALVLLLIFFRAFPLNVVLMALFTASSGFGLGIYFVAYKGVAQKALSLTVLVTLMTGLIATYSGLDFAWLGKILFTSLLILLIYSIIRIFINIGGQRIMAGFGVLIFTGYLLFDFNRLAKVKAVALANNWETALNFAISIYLDIINLFIYLVHFISSNN